MLILNDCIFQYKLKFPRLPLVIEKNRGEYTSAIIFLKLILIYHRGGTFKSSTIFLNCMSDLGGNSYHAIECLDIAEGTRVSNQKMSKEAQENMISVGQGDIVRG